ncbi:MAG: hypothetical protein A2Z14_15905 [Chloroflexi bacterium RBG_16_48_8]|nr:MAG: hypothetical protein A2Z14_15905 [Chloroflexi bacterium RBG_16_48_8]
MRQFIIHLFFLALLLPGCTSSSKATPSATQALETLALPPEWTITPTIPPSATKTPSPPTATAVTATPSSSPAPSSAPIRLDCPPAGNLTEVSRSTTSITSLDVEISGNYAYIADNTGLWVFDITDPSQPADAGFKFIQAPSQMIISDSFAYGIDTEGLWKLDLSDPTDPTFLGYKDTPDMPLEFAITQDYAFVRDNYGNLRAFDLSKDANLREVGVYDPPGKTIGGDIGGNLISIVRDLAHKNPLHSFSIRGDYAYVADLDAGLRIVDISDPTRLREVGSYDLSGSISDVEVIQNAVLIFGINLGTDDAWDLWGQNIPDLLRGREPLYLGTISIPQVTKPEILCTFISEFYRLISESELKSAFTETQPEEIVDLLKGVDVVGDLIYVADERRGLLILQFEPMED